MPAQTVIKLRRDTTTNWESVDPTLTAGEIAFDVTAMKFKVGDGTSAWTDLEYSSDPDSIVGDLEAFASGAASAAEAAAISSANSYSDSLAENYDPAGSAASALEDAETYADGAASSAVTAHNDDTTSVHGIADTSVLLTNAGGTLTGYLTLHADPTQALHAVTKEYADNLAAGVIARPQVLGATTINIDATYNNGTAGVGATLTHNTNGVFPSSAGGATGWVLNSGILVKNQTNKAHNGRYRISDMGSASTPYVLTRCGFCDTADEIPGSYTFVQSGTSAGTGWIQVVADPATFVVGTDNIDVFQFSGAGAYTAGTGLTLTGTQFAIDSTIVAPLNSPTFTGAVDFSGATVTGIDSLPSQTGNSGKYLTTDGEDASWATVDVSGKVSQTNGTVTTATPSSAVVRNITLSLSQPSGGMDGDVWMVYS